jgi:microfibrillar-associated protein 1
MPDTSKDRRDLNLICLNADNCSSDYSQEAVISNCVPPSYTMATHILPRPADYPPHLPTIYQTTNPILAPREDSILSVARLERAVLTVQAKDALSGLYRETHRKWWQCAVQSGSALGPLQGAGKLSLDADESEGVVGLWMCGSYAYPGIALLEGCVVSARNVVDAIVELER